MTTRVIRAKTTPAYPAPIPNHPVGVLTTAGGGSGSAVIHGGTPTGSRDRVGATWTDTRPSDAMNSVISVHDYQLQHMRSFGAGEGMWLTSSAPPTEAQWNANLDPFMQDLRDAGAVQKMIGLHSAPNWMKSGGSSNVNDRPLPQYFGDFATICAQTCARYSDFQWAVVWSEMKAFWSNALNRPDWELYQQFYNIVRPAVKAVRPTMKVGGPYPTLISSANGYGSNPSSIVTFPGGSLDQRWMDAMSTFVANCTYDFLCWDGGIGHAVEQLGGERFGDHWLGHNGITPQQQRLKLVNMIAWIRSLSAQANTTPIVCVETYMQDAGYPPAPQGAPPNYYFPGSPGTPGANWGGGWGWSPTQVEDEFLEMVEAVAAVSPNGPVYWLTWFHPVFWPQVINKQSDFVWLNTESPFRAKVATYHATGAYP